MLQIHASPSPSSTSSNNGCIFLNILRFAAPTLTDFLFPPSPEIIQNRNIAEANEAFYQKQWQEITNIKKQLNQIWSNKIEHSNHPKKASLGKAVDKANQTYSLLLEEHQSFCLYAEKTINLKLNAQKQQDFYSTSAKELQCVNNFLEAIKQCLHNLKNAEREIITTTIQNSLSFTSHQTDTNARSEAAAAA